MSNLPSIDGRKVIKVLRKAGFEVIRIKGSHHFLRNLDGRATVVPVTEKKTSESDCFIKSCKIAN